MNVLIELLLPSSLLLLLIELIPGYPVSLQNQVNVDSSQQSSDSISCKVDVIKVFNFLANRLGCEFEDIVLCFIAFEERTIVRESEVAV